ARVADDLCSPERWTQRGGMRHFAAQPAAHAVVGDVRHRIALERVGGGLYGERRAAGQPDAGVIAGAGVFIDPETGAHHPFAFPEQLRAHRLDAALTLELAFAFGNDDLEPVEIGGEGLAQGVSYLVDLVVVDGAKPLH